MPFDAVVVDVVVVDVIVVGGGSAGAPLAARLSEDPGRSVLLLEAGPVPASAAEYPPELLDAGSLRGARPGHPQNWAHDAHLTARRPYSIARGRILGGSSATNGAYFIRARKQDFDEWSKGGCNEWSWGHALQLYRAIENDLDFGSSAIHGGSGPIPVSRPRQTHPITIAFARAAHELGFPLEADKNDQGPPGCGPLPTNVLKGVRVNTGMAYLNPVRDRPNLSVQGGTTVRRILFDGVRAVGVEVERDGVVSIIGAGEVVLSAGGIGSPHILLASGIGPRRDLEELGIPVVADLPGVGAGFHDHPQIALGWRADPGIAAADSASAMESILHLTAPSSPVVGDLEILPLLKPIGALLGEVSGDGEFAFLITLLSAASRGRISLTSGDPTVPPRIEFNYLSTPDDPARLREGVRAGAAILATPSFLALGAVVTGITPGTIADDALLDEWIAGHIGTALHLCGSARFGPADDPSAVVDQYGRVRGVEGLRVADTSILPTAPTRGPASTAVLIGELVAGAMRRSDR